MSTYTQEQLKDILKAHEEWLEDPNKGERADLSKDDLSEANLYRADLREANLYRADLREANLREANLRGADLRRVDLRGSNLRGVDLSYAELHGANLSSADLSGAKLYWANLSGADLSNTGLIMFQYNKHVAYYIKGQCTVSIGCMSLLLSEWRDRYKEIGKENGYTDEEIEMYGKWLDFLRRRL